MTTIAYKNGILAADSRVSFGGSVSADNFPKIFDVSDKEYYCCGHRVLAYALAGMASSRLILDRILAEGLDIGGTLETDDDFTAIVVTEGGSFTLNKVDESPHIGIIEIPADVPWAIGSGGSVARYVMFRGGDAVKAVVEASTVDMGTGGDVIVWSGPEWEIEE